MFKKINNPILFQGHLKKKQYFEGWYYKIVSQNGDYSLALIPGISLNQLDSHAFIQVFIVYRQKELRTHYLQYPLQDFKTESDVFKLSIKDSIFKEDALLMTMDTKDISIKGSLSFEAIEGIKRSFISPSMMGFFSYFRFMECYHGVVSMSHRLKGQLKIDDQMIDFTGGKGYIEKDWGKSFPSQYVWMQSNHFKDPHTSFMFSHATIPFLGFSFPGLIVNLRLNEKEYRFATYNFSKVIKKKIKNHQVYYEIKKGKTKLVVKASNDKTTSLKSPDKGQMINSIKEGLSGKIYIWLYVKGQLMYEDIGKYAGLEIMMKEN
ncbi:hypothetical protein KHQ88_01060 [Mycoplasmatota bacterium]|nr:hypothetical protein KHQ88_01060 [Mycoplasmatota bacterium]